MELQINYSQDFALTFRFGKAQTVVSVGDVSWLFGFHCIIRHSKGQFSYDVNGLFFPLSAFERFHNQLGEMREGRCRMAVLADDGSMVRFALNLGGRNLKSEIRIREYQAGNEMTTLSAGFSVEYDLFVNKLYVELGNFIDSLHQISPQSV